MTTPANLNDTELKAWEWLTYDKGYDEDDIIRRSKDQTPDFICPDEEFEAKRQRNSAKGVGKITVGESQKEQLDAADPTILVFGTAQQPRGKFRWSEREKAKWTVHTMSRSSAMTIKGDSQTKSQWKQMCAKIDPDANDDEIISTIYEYLESDVSHYDSLQRIANRRSPEFR